MPGGVYTPGVLSASQARRYMMTASPAPDALPQISPAAPPLFALVGTPNCGKTTLFNALTGLRQKTGNYPGVTVEKKEGRVRVPGGEAALIDLPGLYSLSPRSPDEAIARDVLFGHRTDVSQPVGIVHVVDGANLSRNLYLTSQVLELGLPTVIVLTMTDVAARTGQTVDAAALEKALGVPVRVVLVSKNAGLEALREAIAGKFKRENGLDYRPTQTIVRLGATGCCPSKPSPRLASWPR